MTTVSGRNATVSCSYALNESMSSETRPQPSGPRGPFPRDADDTFATISTLALEQAGVPRVFAFRRLRLESPASTRSPRVRLEVPTASGRSAEAEMHHSV